jgi:hypothetical protein
MVVLLNIRGKLTAQRAKLAHVVGHLPEGLDGCGDLFRLVLTERRDKGSPDRGKDHETGSVLESVWLTHNFASFAS